MRSCNRFFAVLLSALLLVTPVLAGAETAIPAGVYAFSISDPVISLMDKKYDMSGLNLTVKAAPGQSGLDLALDVIANGVSALSGYASLGEDGLKAIVNGMTSAIGVSAETLGTALNGSALQSEPSVDIENLFSEEEIAALSTAAQTFAASVVTKDGTADTAVFGETEKPCLRYDFSVTNENLAAFLGSVASVLEANPVFKAAMESAMKSGEIPGLETEGAAVPSLGESLVSEIQNSGVSAQGSLYKTETDDILAILVLSSSEDESVSMPIIFESYSDDKDGKYIEMKMNPSKTDSIELYISALPNTIIADRKDISMTLNMNSEIEGVIVPVVTFDALFATARNEDNVETLFNADMNAGGTKLSIYGTYDDSDEANKLSVSLDIVEGVGEAATTSSVNFVYEGSEVTNEGFTGEVAFGLEQSGVTLVEVSANIGLDIDISGESIAFDYTTVPVLDIENADAETLEAVETELMNSLFMLLGTLQTVPGFAQLMNDMTTVEGTSTETTIEDMTVAG